MSATQEELKVLADIEAAKARGEDPFGDNDDDAPEAEDGASSEDSATTDEDKEAVEATDVPADDAPDSQNDPEPESMQRPTAYKASVPEDYRAKRGELVKEKAALMKQLMDGEVDADVFAEHEARISDALEDLTAQRIRAETLQEANTQSEAQYQGREIQKLIVRTKAQVDYAQDAKAQRQFDMMLNSVSQDPDNAGRDYTELLNEAHRGVLALRGVATPGDKLAEAIKSRAPEGKPPVTLRSLPTAATPNANGDMLDQMGRLSGQAYEAAFAKLSPSQRRSLLDEA